LVHNAPEIAQQTDDISVYLSIFEDYMRQQLGVPLDETAEISTLRRLADPAIGDDAAERGLLATGGLNDYSVWKQSGTPLEEI
jgi:hypothetical protein